MIWVFNIYMENAQVAKNMVSNFWSQIISQISHRLLLMQNKYITLFKVMPKVVIFDSHFTQYKETEGKFIFYCDFPEFLRDDDASVFWMAE